MATPGSAVNPKKKKAASAGSTGTNPYGSTSGGTGGDWLSGSNATIDSMPGALVDTAGDDPWGLGSIFPNATKAMSVGQRVQSVASMTGAQQAALANFLIQGGFMTATKNNTYRVGSLQDALTKAFRTAGEAGTGSLSRYVTEKTQQGATDATVAGNSTTPTPTTTQNVYTTADLTSTVNAAAQKTLGRNATPAEIQAVTDQVNSGEASNAQSSLSAQENATAANNNASNQGTQVDAFLSAVKQHESSGNYKAYNASGGASGAYQYIQSTWSAEATDAGYGQYAGKPAGDAPPAVQDAVARYNAMNLYNKFGNWKDVAESWYYPAWAGNPTKQNSVPYPGAGNTETIGQYGDSIVSLMGQHAQLTAMDSSQPAADSIVQAAQSQLGVPYQWGGEQARAKAGQAGSADQRAMQGAGAFDCSGLVQWAYGQNGVKLPRVAQAQYAATQRVTADQAQPGDLVFFGSGPNGVSHVGIYIGNGQMIDAPHTGANVRVDKVQGFENIVGFGHVNGVAQSSSYALTQAAKLGGTPYLTALYKQNQAMQQPLDMANNTVVDMKTVNDPSSTAEAYFMNQHSSEFQSQNLLGVFGTISSALKSGGNQAAGIRGTPIDMRASA